MDHAVAVGAEARKVRLLRLVVGLFVGPLLIGLLLAMVRAAIIYGVMFGVIWLIGKYLTTRRRAAQSRRGNPGRGRSAFPAHRHLPPLCLRDCRWTGGEYVP